MKKKRKHCSLMTCFQLGVLAKTILKVTCSKNPNVIYSLVLTSILSDRGVVLETEVNDLKFEYNILGCKTYIKVDFVSKNEIDMIINANTNSEYPMISIPNLPLKGI